MPTDDSVRLLGYWDGMAAWSGDSRKLLGRRGGLESPKG